MNAVIYARYSTDMQREASIEDQQRNCIRYVDNKGWKLTTRYMDEAMSGASKNRPDYQRMLSDAEAGKFDVLVVDDLSRLSRDEIEMKQVIRRFTFRGIRIVGVSDGFDTDLKGHKIQAGVRGLINEIYLDDLREKTHRGLCGQALQGNNCGGRSYGYRHVPILDPGRKDEYGRPLILGARREIDPEQSRWVRQIFQWYADGHPPRWIAAELNRRKVPPPSSNWNRRVERQKRSWAASAIYGDTMEGSGILNNPLYIGRYTWNRSQWVKDPDTGKRKRILRPQEEWITKDMPELAIVPQELWDSVRTRQEMQRAKSENIRKSLHANARTGAAPKYLFSGILKCGVCGGNYIVTDRYRYGCAVNKDRGDIVCPNSLKVSRKVIESRLLEGIKHDLFAPEAIELFVAETTRLLKEHRLKSRPNQDALKERLTKVEKEIDNIVVAIKAGILTPTTKSELEKAEAERSEIEKMLKVDNSGLEKILTFLPQATERYQQLVNNLATTLQREVAMARKQIRQLLGQDIKLYPTEENCLEAELVGDYSGLIEMAAQSKSKPLVKKGELSLVAGAGFEPATFGL